MSANCDKHAPSPHSIDFPKRSLGKASDKSAHEENYNVIWSTKSPPYGKCCKTALKDAKEHCAIDIAAARWVSSIETFGRNTRFHSSSHLSTELFYILILPLQNRTSIFRYFFIRRNTCCVTRSIECSTLRLSEYFTVIRWARLRPAQFQIDYAGVKHAGVKLPLMTISSLRSFIINISQSESVLSAQTWELETFYCYFKIFSPN